MNNASLLLASALVFLFACSDSTDGEAEQGAAVASSTATSTATSMAVTEANSKASLKVSSETIRIEVEELVMQELRPRINAVGVVEAVEELTINVDFTGTVKRVLVDEGTAVEAGQLIAVLDPQKRRLALQRAQQMLRKNDAAAKEAKLNLERRERLAKLKTVSKEVLDKSKLALERAQAQYREAEAAMTLAKRELDDSRILAPVAGVIDTRSVEVGETVLAGRPLFTLQAVGALRVQVWVSEANINQIAVGDVARLRIRRQAEAFQARVDSIGINAHPSTGNYSVKLSLEGAENLRPGMTVSAEITSASEQLLLLPASAITERNRQKVVFQIIEGKAAMRQAIVRAGFGGQWIVDDGLQPGDRIAVSNLDALFEGASVTSDAQ